MITEPQTAISQTPAPLDQGSPAVEMREVMRRVAGGPVLLDKVSLSLARGSFTTLVGPSGSGKTTLLRLINRLDEADSGQIEILGQPLSAWKVADLRRRVAFLPQETSLLGMSVRENLELPLRLKGNLPSDFIALRTAAMAQAGLEENLLNSAPEMLSIGQKQRTALARALMCDPEILLLDEPMAAQDPRTAERIMAQLRLLNQERGLTVVMVSHGFESLDWKGTHLAVLIGGRLHGCGAVAQLLAHPPTPEAAAFLGVKSPGSGR